MNNEKSAARSVKSESEVSSTEQKFSAFSAKNGCSGRLITKPMSVEIGPFPCALELATAVLRTLSHRAMNSETLNDLNVDKLAEAFNALLYTRIMQVSYQSGRGKCLNYKDVLFPAFLRPLLIGIGIISRPEEGIRIEVSATAEMRDRFGKFSLSDWNEVDKVLRDLYDIAYPLGMEFAEAMPKSREGNLEMMTIMIGSDNVLQSASEVKSPENLLIRSMLGLSLLNSVFGSARYQYSDVSFYQRTFVDFVRESFRERS